MNVVIIIALTIYKISFFSFEITKLRFDEKNIKRTMVEISLISLIHGSSFKTISCKFFFSSSKIDLKFSSKYAYLNEMNFTVITFFHWMRIREVTYDLFVFLVKDSVFCPSCLYIIILFYLFIYFVSTKRKAKCL